MDEQGKKNTPPITASNKACREDSLHRIADTAKAEQTIRMNTADLLRYQQQQQQEETKRGVLLVIDGTQADLGTHNTVEEEIIIGRETIGLQLRDRKCSRRHATVTRNRESFFIRDLGSTNGTLLNGVPLQGEQPLRDGDKIVLGQTVIKFNFIDETEVDYLKQVGQLVTTDDLTGLPAKHRFDAALDEAIQAAHAGNTPLCVLMMDMDGLKAINDRHGHQVGAYTISQVGMLIGRILQGKGEACRFGGDEFSAFLPLMNINQALKVAEQIRREVEAAEIHYANLVVKARISIGVSAMPPEVQEVEALLSLADQALYRAKAKGRNIVSE